MTRTKRPHLRATVLRTDRGRFCATITGPHGRTHTVYRSTAREAWAAGWAWLEGRAGCAAASEVVS